MLEKILCLYEAYIEEFHQQERNRRPLEGAFGFGGGPQSYPCHEKFAQDMEGLLQDFAAQAPDSKQVEQVLNYIYFTAPPRWKSEPAVYWMLLAVQSLTLELIPLLNGPDAATLFQTYRKAYPRYQRLPVQNKIFAALRSSSVS